MDKVVLIMLFLTVLIMLALAALMISLPFVVARDANQDSITQEWKAITALQKQQIVRFKAVNADTPKMVRTLVGKAATSEIAK